MPPKDAVAGRGAFWEVTGLVKPCVVSKGIRVSRVLLVATIALAIGALACGGEAGAPAAPSPQPPQPTAPSGPPKALEGVTITITAAGFNLDSATARLFAIDALHVYQGTQITFVNQDNIAHDIQSDPPFVHTECPEVASAGFVVPGQSKSTAPLDRLISCGFHDHFHEGDPRYSGRAIIEAR